MAGLGFAPEELFPVEDPCAWEPGLFEAACGYKGQAIERNTRNRIEKCNRVRETNITASILQEASGEPEGERAKDLDFKDTEALDLLL
jgi:hypothetical protein